MSFGYPHIRLYKDALRTTPLSFTLIFWRSYKFDTDKQKNIEYNILKLPLISHCNINSSGIDMIDKEYDFGLHFSNQLLISYGIEKKYDNLLSYC